MEKITYDRNVGISLGIPSWKFCISREVPQWFLSEVNQLYFARHCQDKGLRSDHSQLSRILEVIHTTKNLENVQPNLKKNQC